MQGFFLQQEVAHKTASAAAPFDLRTVFDDVMARLPADSVGARDGTGVHDHIRILNRRFKAAQTRRAIVERVSANNHPDIIEKNSVEGAHNQRMVSSEDIPHVENSGDEGARKEKRMVDFKLVHIQ